MNDDKKPQGNWRLLLVGFVLGSVITGAAFFIFPSFKNHDWQWTGFVGEGITKEETRQKKDKTGSFTETIKHESGKTLWDWLELLIVPSLLLLLAYLFEQKNKREEARFKRERDDRQAQLEKQRRQQADFQSVRAERQAELERKIAKENSAEEAIQKYLDSMANILLNEELTNKLFPQDDNQSNSSDKDDKDNPVRDIARTLTLTILRKLELDNDRQDRIIKFLKDAELYKFILRGAHMWRIILQRAYLQEANLQGAYLNNANLQEANLQGAKLQKADLTEANLERAYLNHANLEGAHLNNANLQGAYLYKANLERADLNNANLTGANLTGANLTGAYLNNASLSEANLQGANLTDAYLNDASLSNADLSDAKLQKAQLHFADLLDAKLRRADLYGAILPEALLSGADLSGADLHGALLTDTMLSKTILIDTKIANYHQIKSASNWEQAIYKGYWDDTQKKWIADEEANKKYIKQLEEYKEEDNFSKPE